MLQRLKDAVFGVRLDPKTLCLECKKKPIGKTGLHPVKVCGDCIAKGNHVDLMTKYYDDWMRYTRNHSDQSTKGLEDVDFNAGLALSDVTAFYHKAQKLHLEGKTAEAKEMEQRAAKRLEQIKMDQKEAPAALRMLRERD